MNCTICNQCLGVWLADEEETGGSLPKGFAHSACFWKRIAAIRLDREEQLRERIEELEELLRDRDRSLWDRAWRRFVDWHWGPVKP